MLKKCPKAIAKLPLKLLLPQRALLQPLSYTFSNYERESLIQNAVDKDRTQSEKLKTKTASFSKIASTTLVQEKQKENWDEETVFELSLEQKIRFIQAAGLLFLFNILLRLSLDNNKHIDSYQRQL